MAGTGESTGITFYTHEDAPLIDDTGMMTPVGEIDPEVFSNLDFSAYLAGQRVKALFGRAGEDAVSLVWARFEPGFRLPRHSHSADCLYFVVSGEAIMGNRVIEAGNGFFVKADQPYTYRAGDNGVVVLEFRTTTSFDIDVRDTTVAQWTPIVQATLDNQHRWTATSTVTDARQDKVVFGGEQWLDLARETLQRLVKDNASGAGSFAFCEVWTDAPPGTVGLGAGSRAGFHLRSNGKECDVQAGEVDDVDVKMVLPYEAALRTAPLHLADVAARGEIPTPEIIGDVTKIPAYFSVLHDELADRTAPRIPPR
ncbi:cupin domain-containing protein [Amycolatopsis jejuensis]|uniref:cupin domain-containing protein n=1 Tax=Amycolatopsis jejuensis TaxID=330084 RepID=UPI0007C575C7|nr:cupin domain-containing protein [Amycolatopsis jejuensis]